MAKFKYKKISFPLDLNCSLGEFKKMFGNHNAFKAVPHLDRDKELEKVWKSVLKNNGFNTRVSRKSKENTTDTSKE